MDFESAIQHIEKGELFEASQIIGEFLENNPDELEFISGYFSLRYWLNRESYLIKLSDQIIKILIEEWNRFEALLKEKNLEAGIIFFEIKKYLFKRIANYYRNKFQNEGINLEEFPNLLILSEHLIDIKNFKGAREILLYCKMLESSKEYIFFLLGDVFCYEYDFTKNFELLIQGLTYFRDGFLIDFQKFPLTKIKSQIINDLVRQISFTKNDEEKIKYWLPAYLHLKSFYPDIRKLTSDELMDVESEIAHLEKELTKSPKKFYDKILARLTFFYLVIIHNLLFFYDNQTLLEEILNSLENLNQSFYSEVIKIIEKL